MSKETNPDRIYTPRHFRATLNPLDPILLMTVGCVVQNLSPGGCCIKSTGAFIADPNHLVQIKILYPSIDPNPIFCSVRWSKKVDGVMYFGLQFVRIQDSTRQSIEAFCLAAVA